MTESTPPLTATFIVRMTPAEREKLHELAARRHVKSAQLVRDLIRRAHRATFKSTGAV